MAKNPSDHPFGGADVDPTMPTAMEIISSRSEGQSALTEYEALAERLELHTGGDPANRAYDEHAARVLWELVDGSAEAVPWLLAELAREREARQTDKDEFKRRLAERTVALSGRVRELQEWIERWSHADPMPSWFEDEVTAALAGESVEALVGLPEERNSNSKMERTDPSTSDFQGYMT